LKDVGFDVSARNWWQYT